MTPNHARRLLLRRNILYCASQQERKPESMTKPSAALAITAVLLGCALGATPAAAEEAKPIQTGAASWYGPGFHGKRTANGETFNTHALTAAHKTLPFGTKVRLTNERTGQSVVVRINDRGPYAHGRVIDLSKAAAETVGISGVGKVTLAAL
jgi:rare lipoprotein A